MARQRITEELLAQWVHLCRQGQSYRSIARRFGVDPRTVKSWVQRAGEEKEKEHWEAVSRQVDAEYLDEHYRMLLRMAVAVLDAVRTDPISVHPELDAGFLLNGRLESALERSADLLAGRGLDMASASGQSLLPSGIAHRLGQRLLDALVEHEPRVRRVIEAWETHWSRFQQARLQLTEVARNVFKLAGVADKVAEALKLAVVQEALETKLLGETPFSSQIEERKGGQADLIRRNQRTTKRIYTALSQEMEDARDAYDTVLEQVSHEARMSPLEDAHRDLNGCTIEAEELVDRFVLVGKPEGQCSLCPNRSIRLLRRSYNPRSRRQG